MAPYVRRLIFVAFLLIGSVESVRKRAMEDGGMEEEELQGLFEVMSSLLEDPTWAQLHPHPCSDTPWPGIQCEMVQQHPFLHVTKLHIGPDVASPPCKQSANFSPSLLKLPYLKTLSLFNCFLTPKKPVSLPSSLFTNASSLEQLVLKFNPGLTGEIPATIATVGTTLRVLSLSQNNLQGVIPNELGLLHRLEQLDLSSNHLTGQIPAEIGGLICLTIFDLSLNSLNGPLPGSIGQLFSLQKIDLSYNKLSGMIPSQVGNLEKLVLLDLSHNTLTGPIPESLSGLRELEYLLIEGNPIGTQLPLFVGSLTKLAVLGFSRCGLSGPIPQYLSSLGNLTAVSLDKNKLNGSVPTSLGALPKLGQLNLSQNHLSGEIAFSEDFVIRLGRRLDVRDNSGLCTSPHRYQSILPLCSQAPPCLDSVARSSNRSSAEGNTDLGTSLHGGSASSSSSIRDHHGFLVVLLMSMFFVIVHYFIFLPF